MQDTERTVRAMRIKTCSRSCGVHLARLVYAVLLVALVTCGGSLTAASRVTQATEALAVTATPLADPPTPTPMAPTPTTVDRSNVEPTITSVTTATAP